MAPSPTPDARRRRRLGARAGALALAALIVAACSSPPPAIKPDQPAEELYNIGMDLLVNERLFDAVTYFNEVERQHPYSIWANKAILMTAYAHYQVSRFDKAVANLDRFIRLHPGSKDIAYAYYLRALCYYEQIADVERDQQTTRQAMDALDQVIRRFPNSKYGRDARLKRDLTVDQLAGHQVAIGRWYQRNNQHIAAIKRFRRVIESYQTTSHVPEALHRLTESYLALGVVEEARKTAAVLGHNFPGSEWYLDSYILLTGIDPRENGNGNAAGAEEKRSWLGRAWNSVF